MLDLPHRHVVECHDRFSARQVSLICGPPGAGKSTLARLLHREVIELEGFDAGSVRGNVRSFGRALYQLGRRPGADVGVVRCAPVAADRAHQRDLCRPSRTIVLLTPAEICHQRIDARALAEPAGTRRTQLDVQHQVIDDWWSRYEADQLLPLPVHAR